MIKKSDNIKYLEKVLNQHVYVNILIIKLHKFNYFYINARKILDKQILRMVYFAMTQSIHY